MHDLIIFIAAMLAGFEVRSFFKSKIEYIVLPKGVSNREGN
jgi:hypothetical protein